MNHRLIDSARIASLAFFGLAVACTQTDSLGNGGRQDAADGPPQTPGTGGATGFGGQGVGGSTGSGGIAGRTGGGGASGLGVGGNTGSGGIAGRTGNGGASGLGVGGNTGSGGVAGGPGSGGTAGGQGGATGVVACEQGPTTGQRCAPIPAGKVCRLGDSCVAGCAPDCSCVDGFWRCERVCRDCNLGPNPAPPLSTPPWCEVFCDYRSPRLDAGLDAPDGVDAPDARGAGDCSGPNPAQVTCLTSWNQCVPSTCSCSPETGWMCTADCRGTSLPLCDGGIGPDAQKDVAVGPEASRDVVAAEAPALANYTCRNDSDCCTVVDTCMVVAYLYSKAPGATGPPSIPPSTMCLPCIAPAVQVRCDQGQCVGEKIETGFDYNSPIRKSHCGIVAPPDAGPASMYQPAYMATQPTSWGC